MIKRLLPLLFLPLLAVSCQQPSAENSETMEAAAPQDTLQVRAQAVTLLMKYPATLRGRQDIAILPQVEGKITKIFVEEGATVRQGQALFLIDQTAQRAALGVAKANVEAAQARVEEAKLNVASKQQLKSERVVSDLTLKQAQIALKTAKAALAQAKAEQNNAANSLSYTIVRSPSAGVVATMPHKVGALVSPSMSQPLTYVSDNAQMMAHFALNEQQLSQWLRQYGDKARALSQMPTVQWEMSDGTTYPLEGRVVSISGMLDAQTGSVGARAEFPNPNRWLISGAAGNLVLPTRFERALLVPMQAVSELQDKLLVKRLAKGKVETVEIKVHPSNDGRNYIVLSGLNVGDRIVW